MENINTEMNFCNEFGLFEKNINDKFIYCSEIGNNKINLPYILLEYKEWLIEKELIIPKIKKDMRGIYLKIKESSPLPMGSLSYSYKDFDGVIHPFNHIFVSFEEDENNIKKMEEIQKKYGEFFMFFNNSDEGIEFWKNNPITLKTPKVRII